MNLKREIWRQLRQVIHKYPNDMELGYFIRRQTLLEERDSKRNKRIHLENYNDDNN